MAANVAALPWYDFPRTRSSLDAVWNETRSRLSGQGIPALPAALDHTIPYTRLFTDAQLVIGQCCGLDLFQPHTSSVVPLGVPDITALDAPPGHYFSYIVTHKTANLDRPRVVINSRSSHSGHATARYWLAANGIEDFTIFESGSHAQSLAALESDRADVAAIDALSWRHLDTRGAVVLARSESAPAPPFIVGRQSDIPADDLTTALDAGFRRFGQPIGIEGVLPFDPEDYQRLAERASLLGILSPNASD